MELRGSTILPGIASLEKATVAALFLFILTIAACRNNEAHRPACPIDGQPPQWSGPRNGQSCEYSHYSVVEKKTHSWWAKCGEDAAQ
jgi:hypothetical protein